MDKCWFVLRQPTYRPPPDDSIRQGIPDGPLCLGHLVPSLRDLDAVINRQDFEPFEMEKMPGQPSTTYDFTWSDSSSRAVGVLGKASVPIASGIPGLDATASVGALFGKKVANYSHFARLDYWMTFPSRLYVNDCLRRRQVDDHIKRVSTIFGGWTMYMVTGLAVARGCGERMAGEKSGVVLHGGVGV